MIMLLRGFAAELLQSRREQRRPNVATFWWATLSFMVQPRVSYTLLDKLASVSLFVTVAR
jgi:hypothetical protein